MKHRSSTFVKGGEFNTLAQLRTGGIEKPATIIRGKGSQPMTKESCQTRGKRKQITQALALNLMLVAKQKGNKELVKRFRNTYYCQNRIITYGGKIHSNYCKNRFCTVCSSNRKAQLINQLKPVIASWENPYFVTLTVANCKAQYLRRKINKMYDVLRTIIARHYKRYQRGKGKQLMGVRSLECTFNPQRLDYHPHLHMIVPDEQTANIIMQDWLKAWGVFEASGGAQHKRPVKDIEHDLVETIKYCAKIFTEPDPKAKDKKATKRSIYIRALYNIIQALDKTRIYESFGFVLPKLENQKNPGIITVDYGEWYYAPLSLDWIDTETGNPLTAYRATNGLAELLADNIDMVLE